MAGERFKKLKDTVVDKAGGAIEAVTNAIDGDPNDPESSGGRASYHPDADARVLRGPAGDYLAGTSATGGYVQGTPPPPDPNAGWRQQMKANMAWAKEVEAQRQAERARYAVGEPIRDLAYRQHLADGERAARDAIRLPYRSPEAWPVVITRFVTSAQDQLTDVAAVLASTGLAARPDLVYGVSRVPDRLGGTSILSEWSPVVEWEVTHACLEPLMPIGAPPELVYLDAEEPWVARPAGDPSVLDEDLALALLATAGIQPEETLGIARLVTTDVHNEGEEAQSVRGVVRGVSVFHRSQTARSATEQFLGLRWMMLPNGPPPGVHVEILNWSAVAEAVHRQLQELPEIPSRFPYLPSTPQELLTAYLEIVGIWPGDCYSAQTTRDKPLIMGSSLDHTSNAASISWTGMGQGPKFPCADGVERRRIHGTTRVVIAYRDRPAYAEGRDRWAAYQHTALTADLTLQTGARRPVQDGKHAGVPTFLRGAARVVDQVGRVVDWGEALDHHEGVDFNPHRYCWPPTTGA